MSIVGSLQHPYILVCFTIVNTVLYTKAFNLLISVQIFTDKTLIHHYIQHINMGDMLPYLMVGLHDLIVFYFPFEIETTLIVRFNIDFVAL